MASTSKTSRHSQFGESAPSASTSGRSYDVFINHQGPDVKHTLATFLYRMLTNGMGLRVFLDSEELELGDSLPTELQEAMRSASLHIALFSKKYAESRWCLDELSFMFRTGTSIGPIFYYIDIGDVQYAKGGYAEAFELHQKKGRYDSEKIEEWKYTLFNVSHNIGYVVNKKEDEDMLLKNITYCAVKEVKKLPFVVAEHPVGLEETIKDFELATLQSDGLHQNVQIVGIWGMGGSEWNRHWRDTSQLSPFRTELDFEDSLPPEEFGYCSSHTELMVNTNRGIWTLAPSILGLKIIVARGQNLNHVISEVSRGLVWLRWFYIGQRNLQSLSLLKNLRILELYEDWRRKKHHLRELWVAESAAPLQLRELVIYGCRECQGFPKTIGYLKHLKKIVLDSKAFRMMNVVSLPEEFCLLQSLEHLELNQCVELSSLPNRIGNLKNLRHLALGGCNKLGRLPDSFKHLTLLQHLDLRGCGNLTFMSDIMEKMSKLRSVGRVASSHHKSGVLETSLLKRYEEVNRGSNEDQSTEQVARIWHWEALEVSKAETWWEVSDVPSLWCMERLRTVHLRVTRKPFLEGCIQRVQILPGEIIVCAPAVRNAASLVNSLAFPTLSLIDSCSNVKIG
ncbi:hypothetical protein SUGI_0536120 [Cryptomeria japonica]|nr:hypothetical protein SUGI_0536120 [Cryptomeria japonica]